MKRTILNLTFCFALVSTMFGCKAFHTIQSGENATGKPYELVVVCAQQAWISELGDTLQAILKQPVAELPIYYLPPIRCRVALSKYDCSSTIAEISCAV